MKGNQEKISVVCWALIVLIALIATKQISAIQITKPILFETGPETLLEAPVGEGESESESECESRSEIKTLPSSKQEESWQWQIREIRPETYKLRVEIVFYVKTTGHEEAMGKYAYATFFLNALATLRDNWQLAHPGCQTYDVPLNWAGGDRPTSIVIVAECPLHLLGILKAELIGGNIETQRLLLEDSP